MWQNLTALGDEFKVAFSKNQACAGNASGNAVKKKDTMKKSFKNPAIICVFILTISLTSCQTYHMTTKSLIEQLADTQKEKKVNFIVAFPFFFPGIVTGNSLREVKVLDKYEKEVFLTVTHHTGVRITKKDGKRKTFYFDTLIIQDSLITGKNDHFIGVSIKPINLNNIDKIELQR